MTYLDELLAGRRDDVAEKRRLAPLEDLRARASRPRVQRDFVAALRSGKPSIVAEIKRASPSAGAIAPACDPSSIAKAYELGGAAALSVLTEPRKFLGAVADLRAARAATRLPVLCKDFIVDEYQVWEAAAAGADAVLLIVAALEPGQLSELHVLSLRLGMACVVEVHDEAEAAVATGAGAQVVGINNRDLHTFAVDASTALRVAPTLPRACTVLAESGYASAQDLARCAEAGIHAVLIGESLMRAEDPVAALRALRGEQT